jgi:hypothetical protein
MIYPATGGDHLAAAIGRRASVHWHLRHQTYSVKVAGQRVFEVPSIELADCTFFIDARLRAMFEARPTRRTVHALIRGTIVGSPHAPINGERVKCDPFKYPTFVRQVDEQQVTTASTVVLHPNRIIEARGLI